LSKKIELNPVGLEQYLTCKKCGFLFSVNNSKSNLQELILQHYLEEDPHRAVAYAKKNFFNSALEYLSANIAKEGKTILDVGCSYGYFLESTSKKGWKSSGVEIVKEAADCAKDKIGKENVFEGKLKEANFCENSFDAITLWDVLAIVDDPYDELKECYRLLKKGGKIGLRTRNVHFQKFAYLSYKICIQFFSKLGFKKPYVFNKFCLSYKICIQFFSKLGFKKPYVFNKFCFSAQSVQILLSRLGFQNVKISNSPLTLGDPYQHSYYSLPIKMVKVLTDFVSRMIYSISSGKVIIGPALLIWAEKPKGIKYTNL
jgi:ubiquinone/menaquinone biosynthesis C-methylase UbiE